MSGDESKAGDNDDLRSYERKLPAESAVTTEHTVSFPAAWVLGFREQAPLPQVWWAASFLLSKIDLVGGSR